MKLALFGGSFDPVHLGHDSIVKMALSGLDIDKLIIMPTFISPFKSEFSAPPELRLKWIREIWGGLEKVEISDYEINLARPVPTIETVKYLYEKFKIEKFYLIIGADHLATLDKWHGYEELKNLVQFVIAKRNHIEIPRNLQKMDVHVDVSSSQIRHQRGLDELPSEIKDEIINFYQGLKMQERSMQERTESIVKVLDAKKAEEIQVFDMSGDDYFVKAVVIATTLGERHAYSLAEDLKEELKPLGEKFIGTESSPDWIVMDLGDILIHLLSPAYRAKYNIEEFLQKLKTSKVLTKTSDEQISHKNIKNASKNGFLPVALKMLLSIPKPKAHIATQRQILAASFKICTKFSGKNGKDLTQIATKKNSANQGMLFSFEPPLFWLKFKKFSKNKNGTSMMTRSIFMMTAVLLAALSNAAEAATTWATS